MRTLCDGYHKELASHSWSILDISVATRMTISACTLTTTWTMQATFKCSSSVLRPPAKKSGNSPPSKTKFLQHFTNSVDENDATGGKIQQDLADIAVKRWDKKLSTDKIKSLVDKCKQPQNCSDIRAIKANPGIGSEMSSKNRKTDLKISNLQQVVLKITFATLQTTNMLIHNSAS